MGAWFDAQKTSAILSKAEAPVFSLLSYDPWNGDAFVVRVENSHGWKAFGGMECFLVFQMLSRSSYQRTD